MPTRLSARHDLAGDEERRQVAHDVRERRLPLHEVVLVRAVGGALVVGVVLVEVDRLGPGDGGRPLGGLRHDPLARLVPEHRVARVGDLGRAVLGVGVVDVEPGAVGQDDVGQADVLVGQLAGVGGLAGEVEASRVTQRVLLLEVPAGAARPVHRRRVGVDDLGRGEHGIGVGVAGDGDPVLRLDAHYSPYGHAALLARRRSRPGATLTYRFLVRCVCGARHRTARLGGTAEPRAPLRRWGAPLRHWLRRGRSGDRPAAEALSGLPQPVRAFTGTGRYWPPCRWSVRCPRPAFR